MTRLDPNAFDRFAIVAFGTPDVIAVVERIRQAIPPSGRPILPAHVTLKGTFVEPTDLDEIAERVRRCCAEAPSFTLTTTDLHVWGEYPGNGVVLGVEASDAATALHWRLVEELQGLCTTTYHGEDIGVYRPHLTIVQQIPPEDVETAVPVVERLYSGFTFDVTEAALVGRRGGIAWETMATFPLAVPASS